MTRLTVEEKAAEEAQEREARNHALWHTTWRVDPFYPSQIVVDPDRPGARPVDEAHVEALAAAYRIGSYVPPITVREVKEPVPGKPDLFRAGGVYLIAGLHRLLAWQRVHGDAFLVCAVAPASHDYDGKEPNERDRAIDEAHLELAGINENHLRLELTSDQRAKATAQAVEQYAIITPEVLSHGEKKPQGGRPKTAKAKGVIARAAATGKSKATVYRDLQKADGIAPKKRKSSLKELVVRALGEIGYTGADFRRSDLAGKGKEQELQAFLQLSKHMRVYVFAHSNFDDVVCPTVSAVAALADEGGKFSAAAAAWWAPDSPFSPVTEPATVEQPTPEPGDTAADLFPMHYKRIVRWLHEIEEAFPLYVRQPVAAEDLENRLDALATGFTRLRKQWAAEKREVETV